LKIRQKLEISYVTDPIIEKKIPQIFAVSAYCIIGMTPPALFSWHILLDNKFKQASGDCYAHQVVTAPIPWTFFGQLLIS
jgi:hypothetical protein